VTFEIKIRGASTGLVRHEYLCPAHGRLTVIVERDASGDPPASAACSVCGEPSEYVISAPRGKVRVAEVVRGSYQKPERETWTNFENLGEGQDPDEWQADRARVWERDREQDVYQLTQELSR